MQKWNGATAIATIHHKMHVYMWISTVTCDVLCPLPSHVACVCLTWWKEVLISAGGDGKVRMYNGTSGSLLIEIAAHGRWISSLDVARENSLVRTLTSI